MGGGHYHLAGSVGDFALTDASRAGGADANSQASAFGFGTVVVAFAVGAQATKPVPPVKTGITDIETLLQNLLPGVPASDSLARPCPPQRSVAGRKTETDPGGGSATQISNKT